MTLSGGTAGLLIGGGEEGAGGKSFRYVKKWVVNVATKG